MNVKQNGLAFAGAFAGVLVLAIVASDRAAPGDGGVKSAAAPVVEGPVLSGIELDHLLAREKRVALSSLTDAPWRLACVSRRAQPVPAAMQAVAETCWPDAAMVGLGGSFLSVVDAAGQCHQWRTVRHVIDTRFEDALCVASHEVPALSLHLNGEVLDIE